MSTNHVSASVVRRAIMRGLAVNALVLWLVRDRLDGWNGRLQAPDLSLLFAQNWIVLLHLGTAVAALILTLFLFLGVKGTRTHRVLGWGWAILMTTTALASFFIREINPGGLSLIHILSGWTAIAAPLAVWAARTKRIRTHQSLVTGLAFGGLLIAGAFTFLPGRLMYDVFFE